MGTFKEITGDLFVGIFDGSYDVVGHGLNCFNCQGAGIVIPFKKHFKTDTFPMEQKGKGDINKLGQIDYMPFTVTNGVAAPYTAGVTGDFNMYVSNCYTQYGFGSNHTDGTVAPVDYEALTLCMRKINKRFAGKRVGLPLIGGGLAGGDKDIITDIMKQELKDCDVTLVLFDK